MSVELYAIAANALLLMAIILVQQIHHDVVKGIPWTVGNRVDQGLSPFGERIRRAVRNHVEGSAMFVPVALAVSLGGLASSMTAAAAIAYVGFRVLYSGAYLIGIPYLRSLLWTGGLVSIGVVGWPLVGFG